jgi:two-component system response regulator
MEYSKCRVLLVEDDHDEADMAIYALGKLNFIELLHIDDGERALQYLFEEQCEAPSIILLDLRMPRVDGIQILKRLKSDSLRKQIPVVALISSNEGVRYVESYDIKPDGYLMKPLSCMNFVKVLAETGLGSFSPESVNKTASLKYSDRTIL